MSDKTWKAYERRVAIAVGGRRQAVTGERYGADVESDRLVIQCKKGYMMPRYLRQWLNNMIEWRDANAQGKAACVVWQSKGKPDKDSLVVMTLEDFQKVLGDQKILRDQWYWSPFQIQARLDDFEELIK